MRAAALAFMAGAILAGAGAWQYQAARYQATIDAQEAEAARQLSAAISRTRDAERAAQRAANELEARHEQSQQALDQALADNRRLARELGGLRDPGRRPRSDCAVPGTAGAAELPAGGTAGARLSAEATEFLLDFARDADRAAEYARSCREWVTLNRSLDQHWAPAHP